MQSSDLRRWLMNVTSGYAGILAEGLVFLALTPLLVRHLGAEGYALWVLSHTVVFYLKFLDFGFAGAQIRYHSRFAARGRDADIRKLTRTILVALLIAGGVAGFIVLAIAATPETLWFEFDLAQGQQFRTVLALLAIELFVAFPASVLDNVYEGSQRFDVRNMRSVGILAAKTAVQVILLLAGHGIVALAVIEVFATAAQLLVDLAILRRLFPNLLGTVIGFDLAIWRRIQGFAFWSFLDDLLMEGTPGLGNLLVVTLLPLAVLTPYSLCITMAGLLLVIVDPVTDTLFPMAVSLHARGKHGELGELLMGGSKALIAICAPVAVVIGFLGEHALGLWIPGTKNDIPAGLIPIVVTDVLISVFLSTPAVILIAINGIRTFVWLTFAEIGLVILLAIFLTPAWGLQGLAAASLIANVILGFGFQLPIVARAVGAPLSQLAVGTILRVGAACLPAVLAGLLVTELVQNPGWLAIAGEALLIGLVGLLGLLLVATTRSERVRYLGLWKRLRSDEVPVDTAWQG